MLSVGLVVTFYLTCTLALFFLPVRRLLELCFFYLDRSRNDSYAYLDVLRGLAALSVILLHYYLWNTAPLVDFASIGLITGGQKSVGVFFLLSSFLIWKSLRLDQIGKYATSRIFRIYPLHVMMTFFFILQAGSFLSLFKTGAPYLREALLWNIFTDNFVLFNGVAWSIVIEMQFYIAAPFLKYAYLKFPKFFVASLILSSAALLWVELNSTMFGINSFTSSQLPWLKFFIAGILLAIFIDRLANTNVMRNPYVSGACILAAICIIDLDFNNIRTISYFLPLKPLAFRPDLAFPDLALGVCLLIVGLRANAHVASLLSHRPVRFLGVISYSFYLSQLPILGHFIPEISASAHPIAFVFFFVIPVHIVVSALLFLVVETPFLMLSAWMKTLGREPGRKYLGAELQQGAAP
jgi:peptidoglycan/LPS O-acetylase OafA/YrhL